MGLFWAAIRDEYPSVQDHPRLQRLADPLGNSYADRQAFELELLESPPIHRSWMINDTDEFLLQVQDDRFVHNWRHGGGDYPRFEPLLVNFWDRFTSFTEVIGSAGLSIDALDQVEVSYVNFVPNVDITDLLSSVGSAPLVAPNVDPTPASQLWAARYTVTDAAKYPIGRLVADCQPGLRSSDSVQGNRLTLTFNAPIPDGTAVAARELMLAGRDAIVSGFAALTTSVMDTVWGRIT